MGRQKKRFFNQGGGQPSNKRFKANPDDNIPGAIISYDRNKQRMCYKECLELFNEYKDILIPSQPKETEEVKTDDMCSAILQELNEMKNDKKTGPTMTPKDLGSNCLSYLQVTDPSGFFSSVSFFRHIFQDIKEKQLAKTRYLHRLIPIEKVCIGTIGAINEALEPMLEKRFSKDSPPTTYALFYQNRCNSAVKKKDIFTLLEGTIFSPHSVDLKNPDIAVVVEVVNTWCGLSLIENPQEFGKDFNIRSLVKIEEIKSSESESKSEILNETKDKSDKEEDNSDKEENTKE